MFVGVKMEFLTQKILWNNFTIYELQQPIRQSDDPVFTKFLDKIRNGTMTNVPLNMFATVQSVEELIDAIFPFTLLKKSTIPERRAITVGGVVAEVKHLFFHGSFSIF